MITDMKATLIIINFALSFIGLCIDTSTGSIIPPLIGVAWFCSSCYILYRADKSGTMDRLKDIMKIDDL